MGIGALRRHYAVRDVEPTFPDGEPAESWKVDELRAFARQHDVDLKGATKKAEILAAIVDAKQPPVFDPGEHEPDEVLAYLTALDDTDAEAHDAEVLRVVTAEIEGQNRAELLETIQRGPAPDFDAMDVDQLRAYADEHGIDLGTASEHDDLVKLVAAAPAAS
jgi:hypothetical protein